jgi:hypothetical protein
VLAKSQIMGKVASAATMLFVKRKRTIDERGFQFQHVSTKVAKLRRQFPNLFGLLIPHGFALVTWEQVYGAGSDLNVTGDTDM